MLDPYQLKSQFPILHQRVGNGKPLVYLDNAATTQKPMEVIDAIRQAYLTENAVNSSEGHHLARVADKGVEEGRVEVAQFINADPLEVTFCRGTTDAINMVARSMGHDNIGPGDEILISAMEHHSNLVPWQMVCNQKGAKLRVIPMNRDGELEIELLEDLITQRTRILAIVHTSNSLGTVNPLNEIIHRAHKKGVPVLVDGAQTVAHQTVDVQQLECDFYAFSGHKLYGPTGIGVLFSQSKWVDRLHPLVGGCGSHSKVSFEHLEMQPGRAKLDTGIANLAAVRGLAAALRFVNKIGLATIEKHLKDLVEYGTDKLSSLPDVRIIGTASKKSGLISFTMDPIHPHDMGTFLDQEGIAVRTGHHCTLPVMQFFDIPGTVRASFSIYNSREDVDHLVESLEGIRKYFNG